MNTKQLYLIIASLFACAAYAQEAPMGPPDGWSGLYFNNTTFQKGVEDAVRGIHLAPNGAPSPVVADTAGRFQNSFILQYKKNDWTFSGHAFYNWTVGGGSAYSLTNPMSNAVNMVEVTGNYYKNVDSMGGLYELTATYNKNGTLVQFGKIDTSLFYLYDHRFTGDFLNGVDYANAATRVVAPPFPSLAVVVKQTLAPGWSITGIAGDAFGDRETMSAGKNLRDGNLAYVAELNYEDAKQHYQLTLNHIDAYEFMDGDALSKTFGMGQKVDAAMASASYQFNKNWAGFGRVAYSRGDGVLEDLNMLAGVRYDSGSWYSLVSQSATRVAQGESFSKAAKGDYTYITEASVNYKVNPLVTVGLTYDMYNTSGDSLLAKDGGMGGAKRNHIVGMRVTSFLPF